MNLNFDYEGAKKAGYSDDEIKSFISEYKPEKKPENSSQDRGFFGNIKKNFTDSFLNNKTKDQEIEEPEKINSGLVNKIPNFDVKGAINAGYSTNEINEFLRENQPERSLIEKGTRVGSQYGLGAIEGSPPGLAYDLLVAPAGSATAQDISKRQILGEIQEDIMSEKKPESVSDLFFGKAYDPIKQLFTGEPSKPLSKEQESELKNIRENLEKHPEIPDQNLSIRGVAEKISGVDLHPEGWAEKAVQWMGFIKNPKNLNPKEVTKFFIPTAKEAFRGATAGAALELAEQGKFGPVGTLTAAVIGDIVGHAPQATMNIIKNPKQYAAEFFNFFTRDNNKTAWKKQFIDEANKAGIQLDIGSLTDSGLIKMAQARAAASGLTGEALHNFQQELSNQVIREYENIITDLGDMKFENDFHASEAIKEALKVQEIELNIPKNESDKSRSLQGRVQIQDRPDYQMNLLERISPQEFASSGQAGRTLKIVAEEIKDPIKNDFNARWTDLKQGVNEIPTGPQGRLGRELRNFVEQNRGSLLLGESSAEFGVVTAAERLANELLAEGGELGVSLTELMQTKTTLADLANWEFGGSNFQSAYKRLVQLVDEAIERTLQTYNPELLEVFTNLKDEYSAYKDIFENKNVLPLFEPKNRNFNAIHNSFATNPDKLRSLEQILSLSPQGENILNAVKRDFAQEIITNPRVTEREIRNLANILGPEFNQDITNFSRERQLHIENPINRPAPQQRIGINAQAPETIGGTSLSGRVKETGVKEAEIGLKKKMYDFLKNKDSKQIMKLMDSIEGIRKLKRVLTLNDSGTRLFNELSRYKLAELIDKNMTNQINGKVKLGTFSNLLKSSENKAIVKELIGNEAFNRLDRLQKMSGKLAESANRFLNTSQSGTTLTDIGLIGTAATGILTGNPFLALPAIAKVGGTRVLATLFADKEFLKHLEHAIITNNPKKFTDFLEKMRPSVEEAILNQNQSE